jgi:2,3-dihydroxybenzoate decarboxylase
MTIIKNPPYQRIATEEAFLSQDVAKGYQKLLADNSFQDPGFRSMWGFYSGHASPRAQLIFERLKDLGPQRIADMDASGISRQIIALTAPGVQAFDPATSTRAFTLRSVACFGAAACAWCTPDCFLAQRLHARPRVQ